MPLDSIGIQYSSGIWDNGVCNVILFWWRLQRLTSNSIIILWKWSKYFYQHYHYNLQFTNVDKFKQWAQNRAAKWVFYNAEEWWFWLRSLWYNHDGVDNEDERDDDEEEDCETISGLKVKVLSLNPCIYFSLSSIWRKWKKVKREIYGIDSHFLKSTISKTSTC